MCGEVQVLSTHGTVYFKNTQDYTQDYSYVTGFHITLIWPGYPDLWPLLYLYLLSDSLVRRIIVPTTCCTRLVPRAGDLLLHRSFSSIYLKRQRKRNVDVNEICKKSSSARNLFVVRLRGSPWISWIIGEEEESILRNQRLKNTKTFTDRDVTPVICGLYRHKDSRRRDCGGGLNVYISGACWRCRSMLPCCAMTHFICCS